MYLSIFIGFCASNIQMGCFLVCFTNRQDARYVLSIKPYEVRDDTLLCFPKNVVIALSQKLVDKGVGSLIERYISHLICALI